MIFYNVPGLVRAIAAALLGWGAMYLAGGGGETFAVVSLTLAAAAGSFYDRLAAEEGFRAYFLWYSNNLAGGSGGASRVAMFGVPLIFMPAIGAVFGAVFPMIAGNPLPSGWFFAALALVSLAVIGVVRARRLGG